MDNGHFALAFGLFFAALAFGLFFAALIAVTSTAILKSAPRCVPGRVPYANVVCTEGGFWKVDAPEEAPCH